MKMRKIQLVGVLLALFAFGALTATSAMATTLLAEWLLNGVAITTENLVEIKGTLLLKDSKAVVGGPAAVECVSWSFDGWVGPNSLDYVTEVLNAANETIGALGGLAFVCTAKEGCETSTPPDVFPVGLPWESEVNLLEQTGGPFFADFLTKVGGGKLGWEITNCLVFGTPHEDECTTERAVVELKLGGTTLSGVFSTAFTDLAGLRLANCTAGGAEAGEVSGEGSFVVSGGGELTASSETAVS
jgi:hypothetical protein